MTNVTATASGAGSENFGFALDCSAGSVTASNLTATASGGTKSFGLRIGSGSSTLTVRNSSFTGATNSVLQQSGALKVISSELDGPVGGTVICVGDYDETGLALRNGTSDVDDGCAFAS